MIRICLFSKIPSPFRSFLLSESMHAVVKFYTGSVTEFRLVYVSSCRETENSAKPLLKTAEMGGNPYYIYHWGKQRDWAMENHQFVLVLDFGGQYNQLIARRVREHNVYCEVRPVRPRLRRDQGAQSDRHHLYRRSEQRLRGKVPEVHPALFELGVPALGIRYGCQFMAHTLGGEVTAAQEDTAREYGKRPKPSTTGLQAVQGLPEQGISWMSHGDQEW